MQDLQAQFGITYMLISHDLAVVNHLCDDVAVLWQGRIVEQGPPERLFQAAGASIYARPAGGRAQGRAGTAHGRRSSQQTPLAMADPSRG